MPTSAPLHQPAGALSEAQRRARYDRARSADHGRIYGWRWQKLRAAYLVQHPICECGCGWPAQVVHHKAPHNGDPILIFAWDNLQALTKQCHDRITAARDGGFGNPVRSA